MIGNQDVGFSVGHGAVLDAAWNDTEIAGLQKDSSITKLDGHLTAPDQE